MPDLKYCTDNAAMIASMAYFEMMDGLTASDYNLTLVYNDDTKSLYGSQKVNYVNNTGDNLNEVFYNYL